ncbi:MAG: hypothetical protein ABJE10_19600 [bacterium]
MIDDRDEMIDRIAGVLRPLPVVDDSAKARVLVAVAAERERDREQATRRTQRRAGSSMRWTIAVGSLAAAAVFGAFVLRTRPQVGGIAAASVAPSPTLPHAQLAARNEASEADAASESVQFVFRAPAASTVRVVGDFNAWDKGRAPMMRDSGSGLWSLTLALRPGRHVYAFVVDDTLWTRDPRAAAAPDADFGRPGSVLLVGRP